MNHHRVFFSQLPFQLTNRLYVRQRLYVSHSSAYFSDDDIIAFIRKNFYSSLYLIGNVWDYLHGFSKEISFSFFFNYGLVDSSCGYIIILAGIGIQKSLIVSQVKVCFCAVFGHIAFAVFVRVQCPWVDVDIRV